MGAGVIIWAYHHPPERIAPTGDDEEIIDIPLQP